MATIGSINVKFTANSTSFMRETGKAQRGLKKFDSRAKKTTKTLKSLKGALLGLGFALVTRQILRNINTYQGLSNRLKLVTKDANELADVQKRLFDVAQETRGGLEGTIGLYFRLAKSTEGLNISQKRLANITETVNKAVAITGGTAASSNAALVQFGQALAGNFKASAQELNSMKEQTPRLAQAIADGLGVPTSALKKMAEQGELSTEKVIAALEKTASKVDSEFGQTAKTIDQAMMQISNVFLKAMGELDASTLIDSLDDLRETLQDPAVMDGLKEFAGLLVDIVNIAAMAASNIGKFAGVIRSGFTGREQLEGVDKLAARLAALNEQMLNVLNNPKKYKGLGVAETLQKEIDNTVIMMAKLSEALVIKPGEDGEIPGIVAPDVIDAALAKQLEKVLLGLMNEEDALADSFFNKQMIIESAWEAKILTDQENQTLIEELTAQHEGKLTAITEKEAKKRQKIEDAVTKSTIDSKKFLMNQGIGLLEVLGRKEKAFAIAAIIFKRAMAIQELLISSKKMTAEVMMSTAAARIMLIAQQGIFAGPSLAALEVASAASLTQIAAGTALGIAGQVIGGAFDIASVAGGESANVTPTTEVNPLTGEPESASTVNRGGSFTINIFGDPTDEVVDRMMERINDRVADGGNLTATVVAT